VPWQTPPSFPAGMTAGLAAALQKLSDDLAIIGSPWTAYTPTLVGITLGNGSIAGRYLQINKTVLFNITFTFGSTSSVTGATTASLPVTARGMGWQCDALIFDTSTGNFYPAVGIASTTGVAKVMVPGATSQGNYVNIGTNLPMTWAAGDQFVIEGSYEAA
jgi:hypothetical protein